MADRLPGSDGPDRGLLAVVTEAMVRAAMEELDRPHVVIARDPATGAQAVSGPYATGLDAVAAIEQEQRFDATVEGTARVYTVAPLLEPFRPDTVW